MPKRTEITKVTSDAKTWARIRSYSTDGSSPADWTLRCPAGQTGRSIRVATLPYLYSKISLARNCSESNSQRQRGLPERDPTQRAQAQNCPILAGDDLPLTTVA